MTCSPDTRPEEWLLNLQYDHAQLNNDALLAEHAAVQQEVYAELTLIFETEEQEHMCTFFIRCDMSKNLS